MVRWDRTLEPYDLPGGGDFRTHFREFLERVHRAVAAPAIDRATSNTYWFRRYTKRSLSKPELISLTRGLQADSEG